MGYGKTLGAALLAAGGLAGAAHATAFTDENAWRAAVSNVYALETWDTTAAGSDVGSLPSLGIRFLPLDDGTQPTVQDYSFTGGVVKSGPHNLLNDRDQSLPARGPLNMVPLDPDNLVFGIGLWNVGGDDQLRLSFFDKNDNLIESVISAPSFGFFGIVNSLGAARAEIDFVGGNGYAPTDDLQTATRGTFIPPDNGVPEPASWALMISGFGLAGAALRRRRALMA